MIRRRILRTFGILLLSLLVIVLVGPFLVPVPPLEGTRSAAELADADSQFVEINDLSVHLTTRGEGEPVFILLHGFGASVFSWRSVIQPLADRGLVIAYDRPAFGLTERPMEWEGEDPYGSHSQVDLLLGLLDHFQVGQAILVGHSAGGALALQFTLQHPERVQALILVDAAVFLSTGAPGWLRLLADTPQMQRLGPLFVRSIATRGEAFLENSYHDPASITPEIRAGYRQPLQVHDWDRALWYFTVASKPLNLPDRLVEIDKPTLVLTGESDSVVPPSQAVRLAEEIAGAVLTIIPQAGHLPHEEQPELTLQAVEAFLQALK